jgi:hypothetical protein
MVARSKRDAMKQDSSKKKLFLNAVEKQLTQLYINQKERGKQDEDTKHHIEGFMHAGIIMELTSNDELSKIMERIYYDVFGMTPIERKLQKEKGVEDEIDWSLYDIPPSQR